MFGHVVNDLVRDYLINGSMDPDVHADVLSLTRRAYESDRMNEEVPFEVLAEREAALNDAEFSFNELADLVETHLDLIRYWSV